MRVPSRLQEQNRSNRTLTAHVALEHGIRMSRRRSIVSSKLRFPGVVDSRKQNCSPSMSDLG